MHSLWKVRLVILIGTGFLVASCQARDMNEGKRPVAVKQSSARPGSALSTKGKSIEFSKEIGVQCREPDKGEHCIAQESDPNSADYFDVELRPECNENGLYAAVISDQGAELVNKLPPRDTKITAVLSQGQFVCVRAIARIGQDVSRYYVTAVPVSDVAGCDGNELCRIYGNRSIEWRIPHDGSLCRRSPSGLHGACASGWVIEKDLEVFSMGLQGEDGE